MPFGGRVALNTFSNLARFHRRKINPGRRRGFGISYKVEQLRTNEKVGSGFACVCVCLSEVSAGEMRQTLQIFSWLCDSVNGAKPPRLTLVNHAQEQSHSSQSSPLHAFPAYRFLYVILKSRSRRQIASCCFVFFCLLSSFVPIRGDKDSI